MRSLLLPLLWTAALLVIGEAGAASSERPPVEQKDVARIADEHPEALELLADGERRLERGDAAGALPLFERVQALAPDSALLGRRRCEALTALGRRVEALDACRKSLRQGATPPGFRAMVAALMSSAAPPSVDDFVQATMFADAAKRQAMDEVWGHAADCDIAQRLGDAVRLSACRAELVRIAPAHAETERALAGAVHGQPAWRWIGLGALALLVLATLWHALAHATRGRRWALARASAALFGVLVASAPGRVGAAQAGSESDTALASNPDDPPSETERNADPVGFGQYLVERSGRADEARARGDFAAALPHYQALARAVPDRAVAFSRLCEAYEALGRRAEALASCRDALAREGATLADATRFVHLVLAAPGKPRPEEMADALEVVRHLDGQGTDRAATAGLECELGLRADDAPPLERCTKVLVEVAPDAPSTLSFQWALALRQHRYGDAAKLVERARESGLSPEDVRRMEQTTRAATPLASRLLGDARVVLGTSVVLLALGVLLVTLRRKRRVRPSPTPRSAEGGSPEELRA